MEQLNDRDRFERYGQIFDRYRAFNIDSQLVYADKRLALSRSIDDAFYREAAQMNMSEVMMRLGMYHDAIQYLDSSSAKGVIDVLYPYYYNLRRTLYGLMADFAISEAQQTSYLSLKRLYTDSLMQVQEPGSFYQEVVHADGLCAEGQYTEALELLSRYESQHSISSDQQAISAITKAQIYHKLGMTDQEKEQLIISACSDMQAAIREYISLRELALLLYHSGDIDNAYRYMRCAIEDAKAGCARCRTIELGMLYPIIESAYQRHEQVHHRLLIGFMSSIVLVAALLAVFLLYNARQRRRLASLNKQLQVTYSELKESDQIKAMYVGRYMEMSSLLIDRFDSWRKALNQQFKNNEIATTNEKWKRISIPFEYTQNTVDPKAILVTISTNADAGQGSDKDEVLVDDIELIYNAKVTGLKIKGQKVSDFKADQPEYTMELNEVITADDIEATVEGKAAHIIKQVEQTEGGYACTIQAIGGDMKTTTSYVVNVKSNATGIDMAPRTNAVTNNENSWYTLDGRQLNGKPTAKGIYIHNNVKAVVK